jgi:hypothetical protein
MGTAERDGPGRRWSSVAGVAVVLGLLTVALIGQLTARQDTPEVHPSSAASGSTPTSTPTPSPTPTDSAPPTDAQARLSAEAFMRDLWQRAYDHAWAGTCDSGQDQFTNGAGLRKALGLVDRSVAGFTITQVKPAAFNRDARKVVTVHVTYAPEGTGSLHLSITQEHGAPKVCGF